MMENILSLLIGLPLVGGLTVLFLPRQSPNVTRVVSVVFMLITFAASLMLLDFEFLFWPFADSFEAPYILFSIAGTEGANTAGYHFVEQHVWVEALGISYKVGVDGISLWLVLLTTLLAPISLFISWLSVSTKIKEFAVAFLLLESAMIGTFLALDLFLFYIFWELMLVPMYLIVGVWGGKDRIYAAVKFFLFTMVGSLIMLVAILYVVGSYEDAAGYYSFDLEQINRVVIPYGPQLWLFGAFALAFAIKVPMFPFHTWLPDAHTEAPTGGSVILAAVMLKLGCYGFIRFAMPMFPLASHYLGPSLTIIALIGIVYGAFCAWVQQDVKKLVAYSSVSHLGFVMLGLFTMTGAGISGGILQMVNHGISTGALFILVGVIYDRRHTRLFSEIGGGLAKPMPVFATVFVIITMSSIGLPGTNGFVGEFMILAAAFFTDPATGHALQPWNPVFAAVAAFGVILAAIYMLHAVLKLFWGPVDKKENENLEDLTVREGIALAPLVVLVFWIGLFANVFVAPMQPAVDGFVEDFQRKLSLQNRDDSPRLLPGPEPFAGFFEDDEAEGRDGEAAGAGAAPEAPAGAEGGE